MKPAIVRPDATGVTSHAYDGGGTSLAAVVPILPKTRDIPVEPVSGIWKAITPFPKEDIKRAVQDVGRLIRDLRLEKMSSEARDAIVRMAESGECPTISLARDLSNCGALQQYSTGDVLARLQNLFELRIAVQKCMMKTLFSEPSMGLLSLWSVVQSALKNASIKAFQAMPDPNHTEIKELDRVGKLKLHLPSPQIKGTDVLQWSLQRSAATTATPLPNPPLPLTRKVVDADLTKNFNRFEPSLWKTFFIRLSIAGDFVQLASLFFTALFVPIMQLLQTDYSSSAEFILLRLLRGAYEIFSFDVSPLIARARPRGDGVATAVVVVLLLAASLAYASYLWFIISGRTQYDKMMATLHNDKKQTWKGFPKWQRRNMKILGHIVTICMFVYLPMLRLCSDVIDAQYVWVGEVDEATNAGQLITAHFGSGKTVGWIVFIAFAVVVTFIFLPCVLHRSTRDSRPAGLDKSPVKMVYDLDGDAVPLDERIYSQILSRDPVQRRSPYLSIYGGIKNQFYFYPAVHLMFKCVLVAMVASVSADEGALPCISYGVYGLLVAIRDPFNDEHNNLLNLNGHVTALGVCVGGVYAWDNATPWPIVSKIGIVIIVTNICHILVIGAMLSLSCPLIRPYLKSQIGWLNFSDLSNGYVGSGSEIVPFWQLHKEVKHRVWQVWWRTYFLDLVRNLQGNEKTTTFQRKLRHETTEAHRLVQLEQLAMTAGMHAMDSVKLRYAVGLSLEGLDVFWDDESESDVHSHFGKLAVRLDGGQFFIVYDDPNADSCELSDKVDTAAASWTIRYPIQLRLLEKNFAPDIVAKRELREKLRVLSKRSTKFQFPFSREEDVYIKDGVVQEEGIPGAFLVKVMCKYTWGVVCVGSSNESKDTTPSEGFHVTIIYTDGEGQFTNPYTGQLEYINNRTVVMGSEHIGLTAQMEESEQLRVIFKQTEAVWMSGLQELRLEAQEYRNKSFMLKLSQENRVLSDAFWRDVYHNDRLPREELEYHLSILERNAKLRHLPTTHRNELDLLYHRLKYVYSHPAVTVWYVFWDDLYTSNIEVDFLQNLAPDLDPRYVTSICYHVLPRAQLEAWLTERRLEKFLKPGLLDLLYKEMVRYGATTTCDTTADNVDNGEQS